MGLTYGQGRFDPTICPHGCGTVYRVNPPPLTSGRWTREILHTFDPATEGSPTIYPLFPPVVDPAGNIYGVNVTVAGAPETETVWKLSPPVAPSTVWTYSAIGSFTNPAAGSLGIVNIAVGNTGIVYVSTGKYYSGPTQYGGSIYSLTPSGGAFVQATVHFFSNKSDGYYANGFNVLSDTEIIGFTDQTVYGGSLYDAPETLFSLLRVGTTWHYHRLYSFGSPTCAFGATKTLPCTLQAPIVVDSKGNIIVAALFGGLDSGVEVFGGGEVFKVSPPAAGQTAWTETSLYDFPQPGPIGASAGLAVDKRTGAVFGVLADGGSAPAADGSTGADGATYRLDPPASGSGPWTLTVLHNFTHASTGFNAGGMVYGRSGLLYGDSIDLGGKGGQGFIYRQTPR